MLLSPLREALLEKGQMSSQLAVAVATAQSFGFEWNHFSRMYDEWQQAFFAYMEPHGPDFFRDKRVLDAGCGSGRFAYHAAKCGAEVWAIDVGPAIEVTKRNTQNAGDVRLVQADVHALPFAPETFDFIYSLGVLHHLPDPEAAFRGLLPFLKPSGEIQIYVYWKPQRQPLKRALLSLVDMARRATTRLPHRVVYALAYPAAWFAFLFFVVPYKFLRGIPACRRFAERIPMKQYAAYPFRVCVNDQLDRFSAPIENRYSRDEVFGWLQRAGLEQIEVRANYGWVGSGRKRTHFTSDI
jgi:SAM-dependent methyltransferase